MSDPSLIPALRRRGRWQTKALCRLFGAVILAYILIPGAPKLWNAKWSDPIDKQLAREVRKRGGRAYSLGEDPFRKSSLTMHLAFQLELDGSHIDDNALKQLMDLGGDRVRQISIWDTSVSDAGLAHFQKAPHLQLVNVGLRQPRREDSRIGNAGLANLAGLKHVEALNISGYAISDTGLEHVRGLTSLTSLFLERTSIKGPGLAVLASLNRLRTLSLSGCEITDDEPHALSPLSQIETLMLERTSVSADGLIAAFSGRPNGLRNLSLLETKVRAVEIAALRKAFPAVRIYRVPDEFPSRSRVTSGASVTHED
jgi:Leucine-rich repeat (LRR) protein